MKRIKLLTRAYSEYSFLYGIESISSILKSAELRGYNFVNISDKNGFHHFSDIKKYCFKYKVIPVISTHICIKIGLYIVDVNLFPHDNETIGDLNKIFFNNTVNNQIILPVHLLIKLSDKISVVVIDTDKFSKEEIEQICSNLKNYLKHIFIEFKVSMFDNEFYRRKKNNIFEIASKLDITCIPGKINILTKPKNLKYLKTLEAIHIKEKWHRLNKHNWEENQISMIDSDVYQNLLLKKIENNILKLLIKCRVDFKIYKIDMNFDNKYNLKYFQNILKNGFLNYLKKIENVSLFPIYISRLIYEYRTIIELKFENYFCLIFEICKLAKENKILIGPGRGSVAGSLISRVLNITLVDPIENELLFERFLNKDRVEEPDIDLDISMDDRPKLIGLIQKKFGNDCVALVATYGTLGSKAAIRNAGRVFGVGFFELNRLTFFFNKVQNQNITLKEMAIKNKVFLDLVTSREDYRNLFRVACFIEGIKIHYGVHAGGVVIHQHLIKKAPMFKTDTLGKEFSNTNLLQCDLKGIGTFGLLKIDLLGLRACSVIDRTIKSIYNINDIKIDLETLTEYENDVFTNFHSITSPGIFQFTQGIHGMLRYFGAKKILDISNVIALFRPGPLGAGFHITYENNLFKRQNKNENIFSVNPVTKEILSSTYGSLLYQEQMSQIAIKLAGFSPTQADILRKAIAKKESKNFIEVMNSFEKGLIENGKLPLEEAKYIADSFHGFARYCFNKSHSISYSNITFYGLYFKKFFPSFFIAALVNSNKKNEKKIQEYFSDAENYKIKIISPCILTNCCLETWADNNYIYMGLDIVKGLTQKAIDFVIKNKESKNITFFQTSLDTKDLKILISIGFFDAFIKNHDRFDFLRSNNLITAETEIATLNKEQFLLKQEIDRIYLPYSSYFNISLKSSNNTNLTLSKIFNCKISDDIINKIFSIKCMVLDKKRVVKYNPKEDQNIYYMSYIFYDQTYALTLNIKMQNKFHEYDEYKLDIFDVGEILVKISKSSHISVIECKKHYNISEMLSL